MQLKNSIKAKIGLIASGIFLSFILLEAGLRLGGALFLYSQQSRNEEALKQKDAYRILCLGESTTAVGGDYSYPSLLEKILNSYNTGVNFRIINKGIPATTTTFIISQLENNLNTYNPDMVITMMGVNDSEEGGKTMIYKTTSHPALIFILEHSRACRFMSLLWQHMMAKTRQMPHDDQKEKDETAQKLLKKAAALNSLDDAGRVNLAKEMFEEAIQITPKEMNKHLSITKIYIHRGKPVDHQELLEKSEELLKEAIEINPKNADAYQNLARVCLYNKKLEEAEELLNKSLEINPQNTHFYLSLAGLYKLQDNLPAAEKLYKEALKLNPKNEHANRSLGTLYIDYARESKNGQDYKKAEDLLKNAVRINPKNSNEYYRLAWLYFLWGKIPLAEETFKKAIKLDPDNDRIYGALSSLYRKTDRPRLAEKYDNIANRLRSKYYYASTVDNYKKLKETLDKRKIKYICMQYPIRSIEPLKRIFQDNDEGITFVDNARLFKDAVEKEGWSANFTDIFGGDFGHCTPKGNKLLAENAAQAIIKALGLKTH